jgi:hypothetical protein
VRSAGGIASDTLHGGDGNDAGFSTATVAAALAATLAATTKPTNHNTSLHWRVQPRRRKQASERHAADLGRSGADSRRGPIAEGI